MAMSAADMEEFYSSVGLGLPQDLFGAIYNKAAEVDARSDGLATLATFQKVRKFVEDAQ